MQIIGKLFSTDGFMPHGHCYLWNPGVLWLHIVADGLIALAYYSIPFTLVSFVRKRKDVDFDWMFICFAVFIVACGTTHLMEIWNIWHPTYWLSGAIKGVTALASVSTAILLIQKVPKALSLPSPADLQRANALLEGEIRERQEIVTQVRQLNGELRDKARLLEAANQELEAFSSSVSHDLRAPLRHIDGFVQMLQAEAASGLNERGRRYLAAISEAAQKMGRLIADLLVFSRTGRQELCRTKVLSDKVVREVIGELDDKGTGRAIEWHVGSLPDVQGDAALLRQVWVNLIANAIKYTGTRQQAQIEIGSDSSGSTETVFFVRDNGVGFDMEYGHKLFGVFQRLHRETEFEGTGIGLANVRRIIARHGGRTWAEGQVNAGATFYFSLPRSQPLVV